MIVVLIVLLNVASFFLLLGIVACQIYKGRFFIPTRFVFLFVISIAIMNICNLYVFVSQYENTHNSNSIAGVTYSLHEFNRVNNKIIGWFNEFSNDCLFMRCGCTMHEKECSRQYKIEDVNKSASAILDLSSSEYLSHQAKKQHAKARERCSQTEMHLKSSGGYCLHNRPVNKGQGAVELPIGNNITIPIPVGHVKASHVILKTLNDLFVAENVKSLSDFGAGIGQYGAYLKSVMRNLQYYGYDGAGDIEEYTSGFVKYSDFTRPVHFPITEWVISLEVGEHIPNYLEGMFIRNLHRHNCRGIILSWGVIGQPGSNHVNLHSNEYISLIFDQLGYRRDNILEAKLRDYDESHKFFHKSAMAFRRRSPTCESV